MADQSGWVATTWGDLAVLDYGRALRDYKGAQGKVRVFGTNGPIGWCDTPRFPSGVVVGRKGAYRGIHFADGPCWVIDTAFFLRLADESQVDPRFAYYQLRTIDLDSIDSGSAIPSTSRDAFYSIPISLPPPAVQQQILRVLNAYDDLIENNNRRIEILEEMAQAIYREWFVEFRYPGHEDVPLVDSDLGPIPKGWDLVAVSDVAEIVRGRSYRGHELVADGGVPFLNLKCMKRDGGFRRDGIKRYSGPFKDQQRTYAGDIVVAVTDMTQERRVVARAARVPRLREEFGVISLDLARVVPAEDVGRGYFLGMLRFSSFADEVKNHANGANVLHLHPDRIGDFRFPLPSSGVRLRYNELMASLGDTADSLEDANEVLRSTRDLLLPRLISGEVDVSHLDLDLSDLVA